MSPRLNDLWDDIVEAVSIQEVIARMGAIGLNHLTHVAVFFWDDDGMHSLVRGDIEVLDLSTGRVLNTGQGVVMWREAGIASRLVRITMQAVDQNSVVQLPLVVGSVNASAIVVDATATTSTNFPPVQSASRVSGEAAEYSAGIPRTPDPLAVPAAPAPPAPSIPVAPSPVPPPVPTAPAPVAAPAAASPQWSDAPTSGAASAAYPDPYAAVQAEADPRGGVDHAAFVPHEAAAPQAAGAATWQSADSATTSSWQAGGQAQQEGSTVFYTDLAASHKPSTADAEREGQVVAAFCSQGHPNQPDAQRCRVCLLPVDSAHPRYIPRPALGVLRSSSGAAAAIVGTIVVGRAPTATGEDEGAQLMRVPSPSQDISRSHVRVATHGWAIEATDMHSTNGTVVRYPGEAPVRLKRGETVTVEPGTIIELGDGVTLEVSGE